MQNIRYEEMLVSELAAAREDVPLVYLPIGSIEYHGFHLPTGFDGLHAYELCLRAARGTGGVVLPPTYWGTEGHVSFPGSLLLHPETIRVLMRDILEQLTRQKYRLVVVFTGHHPDVQGLLLKEVAEEVMSVHAHVRVMVLDPFNLHPSDKHIEHAGEIETSAMLHFRPELVDMEKVRLPGALNAIGPDCVSATAQRGGVRFRAVLSELIRVVNEALKQLTSEVSDEV